MMKIFWCSSIFTVIYFSQVTTCYMYDDMSGFLPSPDLLGIYSRSLLNGHKKYFISNANPKYKLVNERSVESHFRGMKVPALNPVLSSGYAREETRKSQRYIAPSDRIPDKTTNKMTDILNSKPFSQVKMITLVPESVVFNVEGVETRKPVDDISKDSHRQVSVEPKEIKPNERYVAPTHDNKPIRQNYRPRSPIMPASRSPVYTHKVQPMKFNTPVLKSASVDTSPPNVRSSLNDMSSKLPDKVVMPQKSGRKRDVSSEEENESFVEKNKYYTIQDPYPLKRAPVDQAIIANIVEDNTEGTNSPYAVFYRMSPDITEQHDTYMVFNQQDERAQQLYKEREAAMNAENEIENDNDHFKHFSSNLKMHGKVKNFSNFRNF